MSKFQQWSPEEAEKAEEKAEQRQDRESARIETLSDGVFAIAITLLVIEIKVPQPWSHNSLAQNLLALYPSYFGYVLSFLTILVMWVNHHRLYKLVRRTDEWLPLTNGFLLLVVSFIPFPTAVMAENWNTPGRGTGILFYSGTFILLALAFNLLWFNISHKNRLVDRKMDHHRIEAISRQYMVGPIMYAVAFAVGFASPEACLAMNLIYAVYFAIPGISVVGPNKQEQPQPEL